MKDRVNRVHNAATAHGASIRLIDNQWGSSRHAVRSPTLRHHINES